MYRTAVMILSLQMGSSAAMAQAQGPEYDETGKFAGTYLCVAEASGGVSWDDAKKEWAGSGFKVENDKQLILEIDAADRKEYQSFGFKLSAMAYLASVQRLGEGDGVSCWGEPVRYHPPELLGYGHIIMSPKGEFRCRAYGFVTDYKVNLGALRYIETYLEGFLDGEDRQGDTPSVSVGKCARVN